MTVTPLPYRPHPLLRNGHLQTILAGLACGIRPAYAAEPLLVPTHDGEALVVHQELGPVLSRLAPLVILIHGLGGDHRSPYLQRLAPRLRASGFAVWRVDLRGCGHGLEHAWKPANAGRSSDLAAVVHAASQQHPARPMHVVGFSLSGNILLKMLAELGQGQHSFSPYPPQATRPTQSCPTLQLASALAIAPPVDLHACATNMDRFSRSLYTRFYLRNLHAQVSLRSRYWPQWKRAATPLEPKTIRQFDACYTAPLSGFASAEDYYSQCSTMDLLEHIRVPTRILVDHDDPIVTVESFMKAKLSKATELSYTRHGGHMGYFGLDADGNLIRWLEHYVVQYVKEKAHESLKRNIQIGKIGNDQ